MPVEVREPSSVIVLPESPEVTLAARESHKAPAAIVRSDVAFITSVPPVTAGLVCPIVTSPVNVFAPESVSAFPVPFAIVVVSLTFTAPVIVPLAPSEKIRFA